MKIIMFVLFAVVSISSFAGIPKVVCSASRGNILIIAKQKSQVQFALLGAAPQSYSILKTAVRYVETKPGIWKTTYDLGQGYSIETLFPENLDYGTATLSINGREYARYFNCSEVADISKFES